MSMISAQIDELRELAGDGSMEWVAGPIRASVLRDAADTIWQLRDDLQRANAENAKLRELVKDALPFFNDDMDVCVGSDCFAFLECCQCESNDDCPAIRYMWERARGLGVEVDG